MFDFEPILTERLMTEDPPSPQDDKESVFSFYIREPSSINPFNPSSVSTPRKSHHVSMPALPAKPSPASQRLSLDSKKKRKSATLQKTKSAPEQQKSSSFRPYLIKSKTGGLEENTLSRDLTKPSRAWRPSGELACLRRTRAKKMKKGGVYWFKICAGALMRKLSCGSESVDDSARARQRAYYFV